MATNDTVPTGGRDTNWSSLAACRFFLAFVVLNHHMEWFTPNAVSAFFALFGGKAGVIGFLVISGFSVTTSFMSRPDGFLKRRFLRIYPAYFFAVVLALSLQVLLGTVRVPEQTFVPDSVYTVGCNLVLLQMYACKALSYDPPIWSLSIEFSFYVLVCFGLPRHRVILLVMAGLSLLYFLCAHAMAAKLGVLMLSKLNMVSYFWPFAAGVHLARSPDWRNFTLITVTGTLVCLLSPITYEPLSALTFLITMACLYAANAGWGRKSLFLDHVGDISYPLYLLHIPVAIAVLSYARTGDALIISLAAVAIAAGVAVLVERPFARWLKRLGSGRIGQEDRLQQRAPAASIDAPPSTSSAH